MSIERETGFTSTVSYMTIHASVTPYVRLESMLVKHGIHLNPHG